MLLLLAQSIRAYNLTAKPFKNWNPKIYVTFLAGTAENLAYAMWTPSMTVYILYDKFSWRGVIMNATTV